MTRLRLLNHDPGIAPRAPDLALAHYAAIIARLRAILTISVQFVGPPATARTKGAGAMRRPLGIEKTLTPLITRNNRLRTRAVRNWFRRICE